MVNVLGDAELRPGSIIRQLPKPGKQVLESGTDGHAGASNRQQAIEFVIAAEHARLQNG
jgi:hypothetical protein